MRGLLIALFVIVALSPGQAIATPTAQSCAPLTDGGAGITISGPRGMNTAPFDLAAGNYKVQWTASRGSMPAGNMIVYAKRVDGGFFPGMTALTNELIGQDRTSASGETYLYGVRDGQHYLTVTSAGEWSVTLTPVS